MTGIQPHETRFETLPSVVVISVLKNTRDASQVLHDVPNVFTRRGVGSTLQNPGNSDKA